MIQYYDRLEPEDNHALRDLVNKHWRNQQSFLKHHQIPHKAPELSACIKSRRWPSKPLRDALILGCGVSQRELLEILKKPYVELKV